MSYTRPSPPSRRGRRRGDDAGNPSKVCSRRTSEMRQRPDRYYARHRGRELHAEHWDCADPKGYGLKYELARRITGVREGERKREREEVAERRAREAARSRQEEEDYYEEQPSEVFLGLPSLRVPIRRAGLDRGGVCYVGFEVE